MRNSTARSEPRITLEEVNRIVAPNGDPIKLFGNQEVTKVT